jgi:hypothetical protein
MNEYFDGKKLYGNDFTAEQIGQWFEEEGEGYANLGSKERETYFYAYHWLNKIHGFDKLQNPGFSNVLGIGSAWGHEFEPIAKNITKLTIIEPSEQLISAQIGNIIPIYIKPNINGHLDFDND